MLFVTIPLGILLIVVVIFGVHVIAPGYAMTAAKVVMPLTVIAIIVLYFVTKSDSVTASTGSYIPLTEREHETRRDYGLNKVKQERREIRAELAKFKREARIWLDKCCPLGRGGWMLLNYPVKDIGTNARGGFHLLPFNTTYLEGDGRLCYALMGDVKDDPDFGWEKHVFIHNGDKRMGVRELAGVDGLDVQLFPLRRGPVSMEVTFDSSPREPASRYSGLLKDYIQPFEGVARLFEKEILKKPADAAVQGQETDSTHAGPLVASDYHWSMSIWFLPPLEEGRRFDKLFNLDSISPRIGIARDGVRVPIWEADSDILVEREFHSEEIEMEIGGPLLDGDQFFFSGSGYTIQIAYLIRKNERRAP